MVQAYGVAIAGADYRRGAGARSLDVLRGTERSVLPPVRGAHSFRGIDGIHDLGGMQGFGPVPVDDDVTFHGRWEQRTHGVALYLMNGADLPAGLFRYFIEQLDPITYLTAGYYGRWLGAAERIAVDSGLLAGSELCRRVAELAGQATETITDEPAERVIVGGSTGRGDRRDAESPAKFVVGDRVRAHAQGIPSHTRLPAYARGRVGTIELVQDSWLFPDTCAAGDGDHPTWVYAVRFEAAELWPEGVGVRDAVYLDLFEPYIELEEKV